ncbi:MAG: hypothetical protein WD801_03425 [Gemmatimonadaceae bacterium]
MRIARLIAVTALVATTAFVSSGPPWISIEYPANPHDSGSRGAFLLVHAFHHGTPMAFPVSGTAEGLVNGARRTVSLEFKGTSRPGVYALHKQWADDGVWTLVLAVTQGKEDGATATALVELNPNGTVASVNVPTRRQGQWLIPTGVAIADVDRGLRARAAQLAAR